MTEVCSCLRRSEHGEHVEKGAKLSIEISTYKRRSSSRSAFKLRPASHATSKLCSSSVH
jgi:hypothetical protein